MLFKRTPSHQDKLIKLIRAHADAGTFSGAVLVAHGAQTVLCAAHGMASYELMHPLTPEHKFNIGSISKTFTALAYMRLVERGRAQIDLPIGTVLPNLPFGDRVTADHLLTNTAGLPEHLVTDSSDRWIHQPSTLIEQVALIAQSPLRWEPGSQLGYSNAHWAVLAALIERLEDAPFADAMDRLLFKPLGLAHTTVNTDSPVIVGRASGYALDDRVVSPALHLHPTAELGAGGILSTVTDLLALERSFESSFWGAGVIQAMQQPRHVLDGVGYGRGFISVQRFGRTVVGHSGGTYGFASFLSHYPDRALTVIVLSNFENGSAATLERDLAAIMLGQPYSLPTREAIIALDDSQLQRWSGDYTTEYLGRPMKMTIMHKDGALVAKFPLLPGARLRALAPDRFEGNLKGGQVRFTFFEDRAELDWSGTMMIARRTGQ